MASIRAVYFDSALIAKFYLNEPGRDAVRKLARDSGRVVSSAVATAEVSAAFHRKLSEGAIEPELFAALQGQFAHDIKSAVWTLMPVTDALLEEVRTLFSTLDRDLYLRSLDALHVVTAKSEKMDRLYTNDRHLLVACSSLGLQGVNPIC
jgi:predicted nucleic acid-binding protein